MIRIIINDEAEVGVDTHAIDIRTAIINGYGSDISSQIQIIQGWRSWPTAYTVAVDNTDVVALIRSSEGIVDYIPNATSLYPRVHTFFPLGSNSFIELNTFVNNEPPIIVTSGAGDEELRNNTAYGKGLEFWDQDLSTPTPADDQSSFSNGYVLGKLLKIKDTLNCTWWDARYRARVTADRTEPNRVTTMWDLRNGYGKININAAVAYTGLIPSDPYQESIYQETIAQLEIDKAALQSANEQLTADNAALVIENERLSAYEFTSGVLGITLTKETKYGTSGALTLGKITIEETGRVAVVLKHCLGANDLAKEPLELATEYFDNTFVKDFIYSKYCEAKSIDLNNLIVQ